MSFTVLIENRVRSHENIAAMNPDLNLMLQNYGKEGWALTFRYSLYSSTKLNLVFRRDFYENYEYHVEDFSDIEADNAALESRLNELGSQGYNLNSIYDLNDANRINMIFLRDENTRHEYLIISASETEGDNAQLEIDLNAKGKDGWALFEKYNLSAVNRVNFIFRRSYHRYA